MNLCDICKKPCGEYTLCPECFQLMQEGKAIKCQNCGKWYLKDTQCECTKKQEQIATETQPQSQETHNQEDHSPTTQKGCLIFLLFFAVIIIIILIASMSNGFSQKSTSSNNSKEPEKNETNIVTQITKTAPTIKFKDRNDISELTQITIQVTANDNYDEVVVELQIYDKDDNIIIQKYLTQENLTKGKTYNLSYNLSFSEITGADHYRCRIYKYE